MPNIIPKTDIKAMIKDLEKNELRELISVVQVVYLIFLKLEIMLKKVDFLMDTNVQNANVKMWIKMENLTEDKDISVNTVV